MIAVPMEAESVLGDDTPIVGIPEEAEAAANYLLKVRDSAIRYRGYVDECNQNIRTLRGRGFSALDVKLQSRLIPGSELLADSAQQAAPHFSSYADAVSAIHQRAHQIRADVLDALTIIQAQGRSIDAILRQINVALPLAWNVRISLYMPTPAFESGTQSADLVASQHELIEFYRGHAEAWLSAALQWNAALDTVEARRSSWNSLLEERFLVERQLMNELLETHLGRLIQIGETGGLELPEVIAFGVSGECNGERYTVAGVSNARVNVLLNRVMFRDSFAREWNDLGLTAEDIRALPIETLVLLADCDELPAWVQDIAAVELMHFALLNTEVAYQLMGFTSHENAVSMRGFQLQMLGLYAAWHEAQLDLSEIDPGMVIQLIGVGNHRGALTAAISHGDLDTATHVGANVPGMNSHVGNIRNDGMAARSLLREAALIDETNAYAVVAWVGYDSPELLTVNGMGHANAGGAELARFMNGFFYNREVSGAKLVNFVDFAHSFGSTVSAEALQRLNPRFRVNALVTYGSAGFENGTEMATLRVGAVYATEAVDDQVAWWGRRVTHQVDPRSLPAAQVFSAEGGEGYLKVSGHAMYTQSGNEVGYLNQGTQSLRDMSQLLASGGSE